MSLRIRTRRRRKVVQILMNIGDIQIWTIETYPIQERVGAIVQIEGTRYLITQREINRVNSLPSAEEIIQRAQRIMDDIQAGKLKLKGK